MPESAATASAIDPARSAPGETLRYPAPPEEYSRGWLSLVKVFGPGAVVASVTVGTGETIFAPRIGAIFGYTMLWTVLAAVIVKAILVYTGGRHLVLTGEHPVQAWRRLPVVGRFVPELLGLVIGISFPFWIAALSGAVGSLCVWITGAGSVKVWGTAIVVVLMLLSVVQTYQVIEKVSTVFLALKTLLIFAAILIVQPDWGAAVLGFLVPSFPEYEPWVRAGYPDVAARTTFFQTAVFFGVIGGGVQDYVGYVSMIREKGWGVREWTHGGRYVLPADPEQLARARRWLRAPALDVAFSFAAVLVMTGCFMLLGAAVLHPLQAVPTDADLYSQQSAFLGVVHPGLVTVYKAGIFIAIFAAIYGAFEIFSRSAYEPLRTIFPKREWRMNPLRLWVTAYSGIGAIVLLWTELRTVALVEVISPITGVLGSGLWCIAMVWVDRALMPRDYRMRPLLRALAVLSGVVMIVFGAYSWIVRWMPGVLE